MKFHELAYSTQPFAYNGDQITDQPDLQPCVECNAYTFFESDVLKRRICSTECHDQHIQGLIDGTREVNYGE